MWAEEERTCAEGQTRAAALPATRTTAEEQASTQEARTRGVTRDQRIVGKEARDQVREGGRERSCQVGCRFYRGLDPFLLVIGAVN